ncbi:hypothetical protein CDL15_Pgr010900 [Punica granatum]|uniref:Uncharacterized protein n=1 Tax=Punica granatum TaxID=22663 RepID=A0A218XN32_PUNGR|nr:hypothetical protein CDL15_Pgr010900 [Punica granatum]PKI50578.1 hypothetical protein CRG98_029018 [Punica granatum]
MQPLRLAAAIAGRRAYTNYWAPATIGQRLAVSASSGRNADPDVHARDYDEPVVFSGEPEETKNVAEPKPAAEAPQEAQHKPNKSASSDPFAHPKPPHLSSQRLESSGAYNPSEPNTEQRRRNTSSSANLESVSCAGLDGSPWPSEAEDGQGRAERSKRGDQVEDDSDYYKHHKASPLSEVEFADTRKPITRATDGTAGSSYYGGNPDVVGWRPEQLDTAEEALLRAVRIWRESAMRGDPDAPQSKVLRALRGEV